ncbi:MAG TPA: alpha-L-arabinofuranosidase [Puia sp.]|jgi:hypothetical protein|nr:alpha-L-arabinofuranosidase [Puia sp.]
MKIVQSNPVPFLCAVLLVAAGCGKGVKGSNNNNNNGGGGGGGTVTTDSIYNPVDPATPATVGFFSNNWVQRTFAGPGDAGSSPLTTTSTVTDSLTINVNKVLAKVPPTVFGNNSNLWMGQIVTQANLLQYITDLSPNVIRGPGGSISDVYFWNGTTVNPAPVDVPDSIYTNDGTLGPTGPWYGGKYGTGTPGTLTLPNYYSMLASAKSQGLITINYAYARYGTGPNPVAAAAHLAADWVRDDNGQTKYWEIGNEDYGNWEAGWEIDVTKNHDGQPQYITGALYGQHWMVFADSMRAAAQQIGATIYIGAILYGTAPQSYDYPSIQTWNQGVLQNAGAGADFFIIHDYFTGYNANSTVQQIFATATAEAPADMAFITGQISGAGVTAKPIALTEWNIQATGSMQNTSYIAGMHAALTLGTFIRNGFGEASRWDLANGYAKGDDMGMFNVGDEPNAPLWNPRPAFYYMYYFQRFFGDRMVYDTLKRSNTDLVAYASTFSSGQAGAVVINTGGLNHVLSIDFQHFPAGTNYHYIVLAGGTDNPPFSSQVYVNGTGPATSTGGPLSYSTIKTYSAPLTGTIKITVPAMSVIYLVADGK